jgi:hypothetical protein
MYESRESGALLLDFDCDSRAGLSRIFGDSAIVLPRLLLLARYAHSSGSNGTFEVLDSWKGDLQVGQRLAVPELRPSSKAVPIPLYSKS